MTQSSATLALIAHLFVLFGSLGSLVASVSPFWFVNRNFRLEYGIFTYSGNKGISILPGLWFVINLSETMWLALGLALCLISCITSFIHICCLKSNGYKLPYVAGCLGLLSTASFLSLYMKLCPRFKSQKVGWTVILAITSTSFILVSSILHLVAGMREKSKSKTFWNCLCCFPFIC